MEEHKLNNELHKLDLGGHDNPNDGDDHDQQQLQQNLTLDLVVPNPHDEKKKNVFDLLPDKLLRYLFTFVDIAEPSNLGVLDVCSRFRTLCQSNRSKLVIGMCKDHRTPMSDDDARTILEHCPKLKRLRFNRQTKTSALLAVHALRSCPDLASIRNLFCDGDAGMTKSVLEAVEEHGRSLVELRLSEANLRQVRSEEDVRALQGLEVISFSRCWGLDETLMRLLGDACRNVTHLSLGHWGDCFMEDIDKDAECYLLHGIKTTIKNLLIFDHEPSKEFFEVLGQHCKNLETLSVHRCFRLDRSGMASISSLSNLTSLTLGELSEKVSGEVFVDAFSGGKLAKLTELDLTGSEGLNSDALAVVAENCPDLEELTLDGCGDVGDFGIRSVVLHCGKLRGLYLEGIHYVARSVLADVRVRLPNLVDMRWPWFEDQDEEKGGGYSS